MVNINGTYINKNAIAFLKVTVTNENFFRTNEAYTILAYSNQIIAAYGTFYEKTLYKPSKDDIYSIRSYIEDVENRMNDNNDYYSKKYHKLLEDLSIAEQRYNKEVQAYEKASKNLTSESYPSLTIIHLNLTTTGGHVETFELAKFRLGDDVKAHIDSISSLDTLVADYTAQYSQLLSTFPTILE